MNNRDYQIVEKIISEVNVIESLIEGLELERFTIDEKTK